jgi:hypothetical protein
MRAQRMRVEAAEKERDEHFNTIQSVIPTKQEWRVKEKVDAPTPMISDDEMDLLDDDKAMLIKDGSPPPINMDINMIFTLPAEFRGAEEEAAEMCLDPKEVVFEKPEESSQHLKSLYVWGHIYQSGGTRSFPPSLREPLKLSSHPILTNVHLQYQTDRCRAITSKQRPEPG